MTSVRTITKESINELPLQEYEGEAILIETDAGALRAVNELKLEPEIGFDTETRPSFSRGESYPVALLQLSSLKRAYLFRMNRISFIPELAELLASTDHVKVGVAVHDDIKALQKLRHFVPGNFVDLNLVGEKNGVLNVGLRSLTGIFLGTRLSKGAKLTNWDQPEFNTAQIHYAANDALVGLLIYQKMKSLNFTF